MPTRYDYNKLPPNRNSQDIAEYVDIVLPTGNSNRSANPEPPLHQHPSVSSLSNYAAPSQCEDSDLRSLNSFETCNSPSSSIEKIKSGWEKSLNRIRRKALPGYSQSSIGRHPAAEIEPSRIGRGVWHDQFLVDRSLRGMALLMSLFAFAMVIVLCTNAKAFGERANRFSSSIGGKTRSCKAVTHENTVLLLVVNVGATFVLGMSNTYQQLVTSLQIGDIKLMLEKFGDSRVGTNSPFNINHKSQYRKKSWAAWILLVCTSIPIHFLANSLMGPSYVVEPPRTVEYNVTSFQELQWAKPNIYRKKRTTSFVCWSALRTGHAYFGESTLILQQDVHTPIGDPSNGVVFTKIVVNYAKENCSDQANTTDVTQLEASLVNMDPARIKFKEGKCAMSDSVYCELQDPEPTKCRLNIRMNAAFILTAALLVKAVYMVAVNVHARGHLKKQLLTFGDVIVASASNLELRVQGECMVNANESYRRRNTHVCHKHCKSKEDSKTGDEIGHCQKCNKYNSTNKFHNQPQPTIATKIKRSFISNLGTTALVQMCIMMFVSFVLLSASLIIAVPLGANAQEESHDCARLSAGYDRNPVSMPSNTRCMMTGTQRFEEDTGGWGGFNRSVPIAKLPPNQLTNELVSFCISNGAQFIYSLLYILLIYNLTLVSQEYHWGKLEHKRKRLRCTIVKGESFEQDYLLQLPKKILFPVMVYSIVTHWVLGEALQTQEAIWMDKSADRHVEHSMYIISFAAYPLWCATVMILTMTSVCWWAFTYRREGFIPQMFGSIRVLCAATSQLDDFPSTGVQWGDLGMGKRFRHAGISAEDVQKIVPYEVYAGTGEMSQGKRKKQFGRGRRAISEAGQNKGLSGN